MAATASPLAGMIAARGITGLKPLGYVVWFSVPDRSVALQHLRLRWMIGGLDASLLPDDPRELFLFKRALRAQEGKVELKSGHVIETDVRDVVEDGDLCVYQITRVVRDPEIRAVTYKKSMTVTFIKEVGEVTFDKYDPELKPVEDAIRAYLNDNAKMVDGRKVRAIVRGYLKNTCDPNDKDQYGNLKVTGLGGTNLRGKGGGVYFVREHWHKELKSLSEVLDQLYPDHAAELRMIELFDGADNQELLRRKFTETAEEEIDEALTDVAKLLREGRQKAVRSDVRAYWFKKLMLLGQKTSEYEDLLKGEVESVKLKQEILKGQLEKLL